MLSVLSIDDLEERGTIPEISISFKGWCELDAHARAIKNFIPGQKVRISRDLYAAHIGTIKSIFQDTVEFPSGLDLTAANITLTAIKEQITVSLANLS